MKKITAQDLARKHGAKMLRARRSLSSLAEQYGVSRVVVRETMIIARKAAREVEEIDASIKIHLNRTTDATETSPGGFQTLLKEIHQRSSGRTPTAGVKTSLAFPCYRQKREMILDKCLDDYVDAIALQNKGHVCYLCLQGKQNRSDFGEGAFTLSWKPSQLDEPHEKPRRGRPSKGPKSTRL